MTTPEQPMQDDEGEEGYVLDQESAVEKARLLLQDRLINEVMGGLLPEQKPEDVQNIRMVLDIGCGPGAWALDLAKTYPHMRVTGIDNSKTMITHAQEGKKLHGLTNIEFEEMDALQPLRFPGSKFDFVNIRYAVGYVHGSDWPELLKECYRVTKPGGILRLTESDGMGLTNSKAYENHHRLGTQAMQKFGYGFSPDGSTLGITPMLSRLLRQAGFTEDIRMQPHVFDFSYGTPLYSSQKQNIEIVFAAGRKLLVRAGLPQAEAEKLYVEVQKELQQEDFRGMGHLLTVWGKKP